MLYMKVNEPSTTEQALIDLLVPKTKDWQASVLTEEDRTKLSRETHPTYHK